MVERAKTSQLRRLEHLYDISKLLLRFESVEHTVPAMLALLAETLPLRSALLILNTADLQQTIEWLPEGEDGQRLQEARTHAESAYRSLVSSDVSPGREPSLSLSTPNFVMLPLVAGRGPVFGALQVEGATTLEELDLIFLDAAVNQLAIALDRHFVDLALREADRQVRESEEKYRALFDSMDEGFCVIEVLFDDADHAVDYCFLEINRVFEKQTGISNAVGRRMREIAPAHEEHWFQIYGQVALTGEPRRFENPAVALGRFYDVYAFRVGRPEQRHVAVLFNDITTRKRVDGELKAANAFLDAIIDNIPLMLFIKESQSLRFIRLNRTSEELLGWPNEALIGKTAYDFWPKEQAEFFVEKDRETLRKGAVVDIPEERIQTRHQGVRILHTKKVPILDTAGHPAYLLGISQDITERKRTEQEQQFLAETSVALSASIDYEQTLATVANLVVRDFADWCMVEVIDEHDQIQRLKVVSGDPSKADLCAILEHMPLDRGLPHLLQSVFETKQPLLIEQVTSEQLESVTQSPEHLHALRALSPESLMAFPLMRHGRLLGALALISSTASGRYGRNDLRLAEELANRAAMAIESARLYREASRAIQARDDVLGIVAHDLRNPLGTIRMQAAILARYGAEPERPSQPAETIERAAKRMDRLIQDLLDVARMEAGRLSIEQARLPTGQLVSEALEAQRPLASSASLELQLDLSPELPDVLADRARLLQVFENLIGNALKFTEPGGRVTVGAAPRDGEVLFWVADTGAGIAAEDVPHLFDRFWQARRDKSRGAGLGLTIVEGIVAAHGGRIWVESTPARGSTFFFTIPMAPRIH